MIGIIIGSVVAVIVLILIFVVGVYNSLVKLRNKVRDQWSQIDVVLKRRNDLIPNIVETVKGYAGYEKETLETLINARNKAVSANTAKEKMEDNNEVSNALGKLFALAESYPELKANENFLELQRELKETEDKITYARQFYNDSVLTYRNKIETFPSNIIAGMFGFKGTEETFIAITEKEKEVPIVKF